jgi:sporulation protein YlmC with PRC-barrel domain
MSDTKLFPKVALYRATGLIGAPVENSKGEPLGRIEDLILDPGEGRLAAAVLATNAFPGLGGPLTAVPVSALAYDEASGKFILDVDPETLRSAPAFDRKEWPELLDRVWAAEVYAHFGFPQYWQ